MISSLRRRIILGGMIAMLILLFLLVGTICVASFVSTEKNDSAFMSSILNGEAAPDISDRDSFQSEPPVPNDGPARSRMYRGFYLIDFDASGGIEMITSRGVWDEDTDEAGSLALQALASGKKTGRLSGQYKYMYSESDSGAKMILLDVYTQTQSLKSILSISAFFSVICLVGMFLILLPVSSRVVRSYVQNTRQQKEFITNAGHELKTPVAIILSNLDAMELIAGENKWSRNIRGQASRLNALLHRLLFMARMDERSFQLKAESIDLAELVRSESSSYSETIEEKDLKYSCACPEKLQLKGSSEYLRQLFHVLMDNAVQYAPEGGWIALSLSRRRHIVQLSIENNVDALPDCAPETLFDRFYRGDTAHSQSGGHGIGLSAAKAIAEMHGGKMYAEYPELSVRFTVELKG